jgi:hypothetical protein
VSDRPPSLPPEQVREALYSKRFLAADRANLDVQEIATWDPYVVREHRLLVPVDLQALYVPAGSTEPMVRLPMLLRLDDKGDPRTPENGMPEPFAPGMPREPGVHLHWAMPDALLRGRLDPTPSGSAGTIGTTGTATGGSRLGMPALPDRWLVLRLLHPAGADQPVITGWVLFAERAVAVPVADFREENPLAAPAAGPALGPGELTGAVGGSVAWSGVYDAVLNRFAFHDPLADVPALAPGGVDSDCATYLVAGWWRTPAQDPLDAARSDDSLHELLDRLRWRLLYEWGDASFEAARRQAEDDLRHALGLTTASRWDAGRPPAGTGGRTPRAGAPRPAAAAAAAASVADVAVGSVASKVTQAPTSSAFVSDAAARYFPAVVWNLRSSLLHGAVFGVPVTGAVTVDHRPAPAALGVALGEHDDDVVAAFAAAGQPADQRRDTERLLAAFTAQKVGRLATPDGAVEVEEHEHAAGFSSLHSGASGTDRFLQRRQTGGVGGLDVGTSSRAAAAAAGGARPQPADAPPERRGAAAQVPGGGVAAEVVMSFGGKPNLVLATELAVHELARSRVGDVLTATEERVVERPAARFTFPDDPLVAVRGLRRSLRHGGDGRGSADGKLTCRWPTHVVTEIAGLVPETAFVRSLGNGALPPETLPLAREAMLLDPYHDAWTARAAAPAAGVNRVALTRRLVAESVLRFGPDATYDGATLAFHPNLPRTPAARRRHALLDGPPARAGQEGVRQQQVQVADELHRFSLYAGADPDLVGVTAWLQPWVPLWLEWEVEVAGLDPPTVRSWRLGQLDLEADDTAAAAAEGGTVTLRGRSLLTTGGAGTLHDAITDWLAAEDARGADGEADDATEAALRTLATNVQHLDLATAALDGLRHQLLGLPSVEGLVRPADEGGTATNPAPTSAPHALLAGTVRLTRARLLDAFGRTLDVPVDGVTVPSRLEVPVAPGAVGVPPRLLRPARWQLRLVDAATATGVAGAEARVDEIEPDLQVSPVAGFLLPDHLDESLEVFAAHGGPLGELRHEPVGGGVVWEIAPGRSGPADAGPGYGLTPAQQALGWFAGGLVAADAAARGRAEPPAESALSALLRAIDTTLWTVDSLASLGTEHVAGLVGRPIAVVRAQLRLELRPPTDVDLSDPDRAAEWAAAEAVAARYGFGVRIGEVTRSDDGVLGFFVDDDFAHFHIVDKAIAGAAADAGRSRGQLGLYGRANLGSGGLSGQAPLSHPYLAGTGAGESLDNADTLLLHPGRTVTLTLLMHPAGKAHLTSGVLPRRAVALARNWVGPGLAAIAPSLRTGPVLVEIDLDEAAQVRLPKVSVFGTDQSFLWRDTPGTWRTDAILAATQSALLPDGPGELREGWIRVSPEPPVAAPGTATTSGEGTP